jgi:hypothetical protein
MPAADCDQRLSILCCDGGKGKPPLGIAFRLAKNAAFYDPNRGISGVAYGRFREHYTLIISRPDVADTRGRISDAQFTARNSALWEYGA